MRSRISAPRILLVFVGSGFACADESPAPTGLDAGLTFDREDGAELIDADADQSDGTSHGDATTLADATGLDARADPVWRQLPTADPTPGARDTADAEFDGRTGSVLLFGGCLFQPDGSCWAQSDIWSLDPGSAAWRSVEPAGVIPFAPTHSHTTTFDAATGRLFLFLPDEVWVLHDAAGPDPRWQAIDPVGTRPPRRVDPSIAFDSQGDRAFVFGGLDPTTFVALDDFWVLSNPGRADAVWEEIVPPSTGVHPRPRASAGAAFDSGRFYLFGGDDNGANVYTDLWVWSEGWTQVSNSSAPSDSTAFHLDADRRQLVSLTGAGGSLWIYGLDDRVWRSISVAGPLPPWRATFSTAYDPALDRLFLMGGFDFFTHTAIDDVWVLEHALGM